MKTSRLAVIVCALLLLGGSALALPHTPGLPQECHLTVHNRTMHTVAIYVNGVYAGTANPQEDLFRNVPAGTIKLWARAARHLIAWGPCTYTPVSDNLTWTLTP